MSPRMMSGCVDGGGGCGDGDFLELLNFWKTSSSGLACVCSE